MPTGLPKPQYVDRPEIVETFADSIREFMYFDGSAVRLEFCLTRYDQPKQGEMPKSRQYPVARMILSPSAATDLYNKLSQFIEVMKQKGLVTEQPPTPIASRPN